MTKSIDSYLKYKVDSGKDIKFNPIPIPAHGYIEDFRFVADATGGRVYTAGNVLVYEFKDSVTIGTHSQRAMQWILNYLEIQDSWREHYKNDL
jgi:hypothetical protein